MSNACEDDELTLKRVRLNRGIGFVSGFKTLLAHLVMQNDESED